MFVLLNECLWDVWVWHRTTEPMRRLHPEVRERMNRDADIKLPSTNGILSLSKQKEVCVAAASTPSPSSPPAAGLIL